jgi:hypothetical protein
MNIQVCGELIIGLLLCLTAAGSAGPARSSVLLVVDHHGTDLWSAPRSAIAAARDQRRVADGRTSRGRQPIRRG